jgi:hypothetical protein
MEKTMRTWVAFGRDAEGVHCYHFTLQSTSKEAAKNYFNRVAKKNGWEPFDELEVKEVQGTPERKVLNKVAFFPA